MNGNINKLVELANAAARGERADAGQQTLGHLVDILTMADPAMEVEWDTGAQFGNAPIRWHKMPPISSEHYSQPAHDTGESETAHPSCYRGYYQDCTFNCDPSYERATVGHVLAMVRDAMGRSFSGYKGGVYAFDLWTPVWGGTTSYSSTGDRRFLVGFHLSDDRSTLILDTESE